MNTSKVNRVEVIDHTPHTDESDQRGRVYVRWADDIQVELLLQDDGRTLKVFITKQ